MSTVRLGIVGCGSIFPLNANGYATDNRCEIVAVCDPIKERAERKATQLGIAPTVYTNYEDFLADDTIDAIEILTPTQFHAEQIIAGLKAGKHVSCQKPLATDMEEADHIIDAANKAKTIFRVTENFLYYPPIIKAKELIDCGVIGDPNLIRIRTILGSETNHGTEWLREPGALTWRRDANKLPGGIVFDHGVHSYATAMWWVGDPEQVFGIVNTTNDFHIEAPAATTWKFRDRTCIGIFDYALTNQMTIKSKYYAMDEFFEIYGPKGSIMITRCTGEVLDMPPLMVVTEEGNKEIEVAHDWIEGFNGAARDFIDGIVTGGQPMMDAESARTALRAALAVYESSNSGLPVQL